MSSDRQDARLVATTCSMLACAILGILGIHERNVPALLVGFGGALLFLYLLLIEDDMPLIPPFRPDLSPVEFFRSEISWDAASHRYVNGSTRCRLCHDLLHTDSRQARVDHLVERHGWHEGSPALGDVR